MLAKAWLPKCKMERIVVHWTAGNARASEGDRGHYHLLIESDGRVVLGLKPISANARPIRGSYAAHTRGLNSGSIGVALCGMVGAVERPFSAGKAPITLAQWDSLIDLVRELTRAYGIAITPQTVLSHAEVEKTLGIAQRGKWDIARLPWNPKLTSARAVGDTLRAAL